MATDLKISELPIASNIGLNDVSVLTRNDADYQFTFQALIALLNSNINTSTNISFGNVLPQNNIGKDGDIFINTSAGSFAKRISGTWNVVYTIQSTSTANDGTVLFGQGIPGNNTGNDQDTYVNTLTGVFYKKASGTWAQVFSMLSGPSGPPGPKGDTGQPGVDGNSILSGEGLPSNQSTGKDGDYYINTISETLYGPKANGIWPGQGLPLSGVETFDSDFTVSLSGGKNFLKWVSGQTVPATGKTPKELMLEGAVEALPPTVNLSSSTVVAFNQTAINNVLNFSYVINSLGASVASVSLQWRRNNTGSWSTLDTSTTDSAFTHTLNDTSFNTQPFNYQLIVTDSAGGTNTATLSITPQSYTAPSITISQVGHLINSAYETNAHREMGNVSSDITISVTQRSANVPLTSWQLQYSTNGGAWTDVGTPTSITGSNASATVNDNNSSLNTSSSIAYRVKVIDIYQTAISNAAYSGSASIAFDYPVLYGYNDISSGFDIYATGTKVLQSAANSIAANFNASNAEYLWFAHLASAATKTTWYVNALNNGSIGGSTNLFGSPSTVSLTETLWNASYKLYMSNYQTSSTSTMTIS